MENASKALLMTGGILIGIILLTLGVYLYGIMRDAEQTRATILSEEQLVKYNQEYTSYDKGAMYGTDVISVLNKAINNNKLYEDDESMWIDVKFRLLDDVSTVTNVYTWDKKTKKYVLNNSETKKIKSTYGFNKDTDYYLLKNLNEISSFLSEGVKETSNKKEDLSTTDNIRLSVDGHNPYKITYSGFSDFKRMIFKCTDIKYNDVGKVNYLEFKQIKSSSYN